jgi:group I intron endonuclease
MFQNLINGKRYIGSSENLLIRFSKYFNTNYLLRNTCMYICRAMFKDGYSNFSLTILEYCEPDKCCLRKEREDYYFKLLKPEYNISLDPSAPFAGRTHSEESKKKISDTHKKIYHSGRFQPGEDHPNFAKTFTHSEETRQIMSEAKKGEKKILIMVNQDPMEQESPLN